MGTTRGGPSIERGCTHVHPKILANEIEVSRLDSDPSTNSFVRVWGAPSRPAEGKRRGGHTWRMRSSPAKGWAKTGQIAPPLAQSSPPGKEEESSQGGESERKL